MGDFAGGDLESGIEIHDAVSFVVVRVANGATGP
jgi:hypothetical protein